MNGMNSNETDTHTIMRYHVSLPTASGTRPFTFVHSSSKDLTLLFVPGAASVSVSGCEAMLAMEIKEGGREVVMRRRMRKPRE
jgi:hypothetical protein